MILYHWTCANLALRIRETGLIQPAAQPELGGLPLIWLSDYRQRSRHLAARLALESHTNRRSCVNVPYCNPISERFAIPIRDSDADFVEPFAALREDHPDTVRILRSIPGAHTWRWWVTPCAIRLTAPRKPNRLPTEGEVRV